MPRYELTYRDAAGRKMGRILFADEDSEVTELIAQEGLREATVRPSLRLDRPRPRSVAPAAVAVAAAEAAAVKPAARKGRPIEIEIVSRPADLGGDSTGWGPDGPPDWVKGEDASETQRGRRLGLARSKMRQRERQRWNSGKKVRTGLVHEAVVDALERGTLDIGRCYLASEVEAIVGTFDRELLAMRLAEGTLYRMRVDCVKGKRARVTFLNLGLHHSGKAA